MTLCGEILGDVEVGWLLCQLQEDWLMDMGMIDRVAAGWRARKMKEVVVDVDSVSEHSGDLGEMGLLVERKLEELRKLLNVDADVEQYRNWRRRGEVVSGEREIFQRVRERDFAEYERTGRYLFGELFGSSGRFEKYCEKWCGRGGGDRLKLLGRLKLQ